MRTRGCSTGRTSGSSRWREFRSCSPGRACRSSTCSRGVGATSNFDRFRQIMAPVLGPLGIDPARFAAQTQAVQYLVRAVRGAAGRGRRHAPLVAPGLGDRQRGEDPGALTVPGHHPGRPRRDRNGPPVRGPGPDPARRAEGLPPAADRDPEGRSSSLAACLAGNTAT